VNWLDYVLIAYFVFGAWAGMRMGLLATLASLAAYAAGIVAATRFGDPLLATADARWHLSGNFAHWLATSAAPVQALLPLYHSQLGIPAAGNPSPAAVDVAAAGLILHYAAFLAIFLVVHAVVWAILGSMTAGAMRRGPAGFVNALLGLLAGALERAAVATFVLGLLVSLGAIAALAPLSQALAASHLTPWLLTAFRSWEPAAAHWWAAVG